MGQAHEAEEIATQSGPTAERHEPQTDFIYAVISEEFGLLGALIVVALFGIFLYRGMRTALATQDPFARYLARRVPRFARVRGSQRQA